MKIRTAKIEDTKSIISLWEKTKLTRPWNNLEEDIKRAQSTPISALFVGEIENKLMGTVMTGYDGHRGWIYYLAVEPGYQKKGYGKQLVQTAEKWLEQQGAPKVLLMVRKTNEAIIKFYTDMGYEDNDVVVVGKWLGENIDVPSPINFHNQQEAEEWVQSTVEKRPYRQDFFAAFAKEINTYFNKQVTILEIGSGPGHLARHILENCNIKQYLLLDSSTPMHEIAKKHLGRLADKAISLQKDFKSPDWYRNLEKVDVIVTMQAAHEVRHKNHIGNLFIQLSNVLKEDGLLLYSDHYYTPDSKTKHPELYLTMEEQPKALKKSGFCEVERILDKGGMALYRAKI